MSTESKTEVGPRWLWRLVRRLCFPFTQRRCARRLSGGKWELWWADPCNNYVWLDVGDWTPKGKRPGGCAIWEQDPAPLAREDYSSPNVPSEPRHE